MTPDERATVEAVTEKLLGRPAVGERVRLLFPYGGSQCGVVVRRKFNSCMVCPDGFSEGFTVECFDVHLQRV